MAGRWWGFGLHYAWAPIVTFAVGLATIVTLLVLWLATGHPRYMRDEATVVYISDVGAAHHTVFMALAIPTAVLFFLTFCLDLHLRHFQRLPQRQRGRERWWAAVSVLFAFFTMLFCILLTIFDAFHHDNLHWGFAVVFFISLIICGIAYLVEIGQLSRDYMQNSLLRASFFVKLTVILLGVASLISIGVIAGICNHRTPPGVETPVTCNRPASGEAALEWFLAVLFLAFIASMVLDLWPSRYTSRHVPRQPRHVLTQLATNPMGVRDPEMGAAQPNGAAGVGGVKDAHANGWQAANGAGQPYGANPQPHEVV